MSKPIARVTFVVLISLVLIAVTSASARAWLGGTSEVTGAQAHVVDGLQTNFNHDRSTVSELNALQMQGSQSLDQTGTGHSCESEAQVVPQD